MVFFLNLVIGAALGAAFVLLTRLFGRLERPLLAGCLLLAALAYVGLGLGARSISDLIPGLAGAALFAGFGALGVISSMWFLALGWALHAGWDLVLPAVADVSYMPPWYAPACAGFDVLVASYVLLRARGLLPVGARGSERSTGPIPSS